MAAQSVVSVREGHQLSGKLLTCKTSQKGGPDAGTDNPPSNLGAIGLNSIPMIGSLKVDVCICIH